MANIKEKACFWSYLCSVSLLFLCVQQLEASPGEVRSVTRGSAVHSAKMNVVFVNGGMNSQSMYSHPLGVFKDLGWESTFYGLDDLLNLGVDALFKKPVGLFVFTLGFDFWRASKESHVRESLCKAISRAVNVSGGVTVFSVPDSLGAQHALLDASLDVFFKEIGLDEFSSMGSSKDFEKKLLVQRLKSFLKAPLCLRSMFYDTTLRVAKPSKVPKRLPLQTFIKTKDKDLAFSLPYWYAGRFNSRGALAPLLPFGFVLYSNARQHSIVFVSESILRTCGVSEDFLMFPVKSSRQRDLERLIQLFWGDVSSWATYSGSLAQGAIESQMRSKAAGRKFKTVFTHIPEEDSSVKKKLTGWMELAVFEKSKEEYDSEWRKKTLKQQELIDDILASKLDYLWLSLSPQMYYGVHAKYSHKKSAFEGAVKRFFRMLSQSAKAQGVDKIPQILVGYEIANNLYEPHLPLDYAVDIFGNQYRDVPNPANSRFWQDEIIDPFQKFMAFIKTLSAEDMVPVAGVVFDLELYGRRLEGQFIPTMMCGASTRKTFMQGKAREMPHDAFVRKLTQEKMWKKYQAYVGGLVAAIGAKIRQEVIKNSKTPKPVFAVYTPAVMTDWFYKNFFKGLVPSGESLHWFSFNTKFSRIKKAVEHEFGGMRIDHSSVVMLSKITDNQKHVAFFLERISQYNSGLWFNRWSRLVEPHDPAAWHYVEQPRMFEPLSKERFRDTLSRGSLGNW